MEVILRVRGLDVKKKDEHQPIYEYIESNPLNWVKDDEYPWVRSAPCGSATHPLLFP